MTTEPLKHQLTLCPGNHEANCDNGGTTDKATGQKYNESICMVGQTNFTGYINHFRMPSDVSGGVGNFWYSWDYGMVHFVQFNTETDFPDAPEGVYSGPFGGPGQQLAWLEADLAAVNRTVTPWVGAFFLSFPLLRVMQREKKNRA